MEKQTLKNRLEEILTDINYDDSVKILNMVGEKIDFESRSNSKSK